MGKNLMLGGLTVVAVLSALEACGMSSNDENADRQSWALSSGGSPGSGGSMSISPPACDPNSQSQLCPGVSLHANDVRTAGNYQLIYQTDGNLVLYRQSDMKPMWNTHTAGTPPGRVYVGLGGRLIVETVVGETVYTSPNPADLSPPHSYFLVLSEQGIAYTARGGAFINTQFVTGDPECKFDIANKGVCCPILVAPALSPAAANFREAQRNVARRTSSRRETPAATIEHRASSRKPFEPPGRRLADRPTSARLARSTLTNP